MTLNDILFILVEYLNYEDLCVLDDVGIMSESIWKIAVFKDFGKEISGREFYRLCYCDCKTTNIIKRLVSILETKTISKT
jgi:hypothetical protein